MRDLCRCGSLPWGVVSLLPQRESRFPRTKANIGHEKRQGAES